MNNKGLLADGEMNYEEVIRLFRLATAIKKNPQAFLRKLDGRRAVLFFEKDSLRTVGSFELGLQHLGFSVTTNHGKIGDREAIHHAAAVAGRYADLIVARVYAQAAIESLMTHSGKLVINALSDLWHPCQALADLMTIRERFPNLAQIKLAYVGDGNNVCRSLMVTGALMGMEVAVAAPEGYKPGADAFEIAEATKAGKVWHTCSPVEAVSNADVVYTDAWVSMGDEAQTEERKRIFSPYQVNQELMQHAAPGALFMHCMPVHIGQEVTEEVCDGAQSVIIDQAENRLWSQMALVLMLFGEGGVIYTNDKGAVTGDDNISSYGAF